MIRILWWARYMRQALDEQQKAATNDSQIKIRKTWMNGCNFGWPELKEFIHLLLSVIHTECTVGTAGMTWSYCAGCRALAWSMKWETCCCNTTQWWGRADDVGRLNKRGISRMSEKWKAGQPSCALLLSLPRNSVMGSITSQGVRAIHVKNHNDVKTHNDVKKEGQGSSTNLEDQSVESNYQTKQSKTQHCEHSHPTQSGIPTSDSSPNSAWEA